MALLRRIRSLLYTEGYTIKGVQRLLRDGTGRQSGEAADDDELPAEAAGASAKAPAGAGRRRDRLHDVLAELEALRAVLREQGY